MHRALVCSVVLEFSVQGGWIRREEQVNGGRMLTIDTRNGHVFQITRRRGGGSYHQIFVFS